MLGLHNGSTRVIASRDHAAVDNAYQKVHAAMNARSDFSSTVTIENSTVVIDSYVGRDAKTDLKTGEPPKQASK